MAAPQALTCQKCQAPLPAPSGPTAQCTYCKTVNTVQVPLGTAQLRAVLREELGNARQASSEPPAKPPRALLIIVGLMTTLFVAGVSVAFLLIRVPASRPPTVRPTATQPTPPSPPPEPSRPPSPTTLFGNAQAIHLSSDTIILLTESQLAVIDRASRNQRWAAPLRSSEGRLAVAGDTVLAANTLGAYFFSLRTGEKHGSFLWKSDGFKVVTCATKSGTFLVKTVFDGLYRFDGSGQKTDNKESCELNDNIDTDIGQRVGWGGPQLANLTCRYFFVRRNSRISFCEEDGTKAHFLVDHVGPKVRWRGLRGAGALGNPDYVAEHQGLVIVGERRMLEAFDGETGALVWSWSTRVSDVCAASDGEHLFVSSEGVLVELDVRTGEEVRRIAPPQTE